MKNFRASRFIVIAGIIIISLGSILAGGNSLVMAQDEDPPAPEDGSELVVPVGDEYLFTNLGFGESTLIGPYDSAFFGFGLPPDWVLSPGSKLNLDLALFLEDGRDPTLQEQKDFFAGTLEVSYNGAVIDTILLNANGEQSYEISIPEAALESPNDDNRQTLFFFLVSEGDCTYDRQTSLVIRQTSSLVLPHQTIVPDIDLTKLPLPIFQTASIMPDQAVLVVPDQPTEAELQAAFAVSAGFGRLSGGNLQLSLTTVSQLDPVVRDNSHLIFVGKGAGLPLLGQVALPAPLGGTEFSASGAQADDGIVQMANSPWNQSKAVLVVSGNSDLAVVKAGQALSSGSIFSGDPGNIALVSGIQPAEVAYSTAANRTFTDLGYEDIVITRVGVIRESFNFYIPPGQVVTGNASLELHFSHSSILNYERSGLVVDINGDLIGSVRFSDDTAQDNTQRFRIPASSVLPGNNVLNIRADLIPVDVCSSLLLNNLWMSIRADSILRIPLSTAGPSDQARIIDLEVYPELLQLSPAEDSFVFVIPQSDVNAWNMASSIAFNLGDELSWSIAEHQVVYVNNLSPEIRQQRDLVLIGRPSSLPLIGELNGVLPGSFSGDELSSQPMQVNFRVPPGGSVGYLELVDSPFGTDHAILAVLGNNDQGLVWAGNALTDPGLQGDLVGDFAIANEDQVFAVDSRGIQPGGSAEISEQEGVVEVVPEVESQVDDYKRPAWILPGIGAVIVLMIGILAFAAISSMRKRG
jgi:cellulose synthase operon protein B